MADATDEGYDEATNRNDGRGTIPDGVDEDDLDDAVDDADDQSTEDNPFDDVHSAEQLGEKVEPPSAQAEDINSRDNEAQWSREQ